MTAGTDVERTTVELIRGVSPVLATPFGPGGELDTASLRTSIARLLDAGVTSMMFPGFASEFHQLDDDEKQRLLAEVLDVASGSRAVVIGSVSDNSTIAACRRATAMVDNGVHAVNVLPPSFQDPPIAAVLDHISAVADAVAPAPVIVQYVPHEASTRLSTTQIRTLASEHPNISFVKAELRSPADYIRSLRDGTPSIASLAGNGGIDMPAAMEAGAVGVQPGGGFVEVYLAIWQAWHDGDTELAEQIHRRLLPFLSYWIGSGTLTQAGKAIAYRRGEIASPHCRAPVAGLGDHDAQLVDRFLDEFAEELK